MEFRIGDMHILLLKLLMPEPAKSVQEHHSKTKIYICVLMSICTCSHVYVYSCVHAGMHLCSHVHVHVHI